MMMMMRAVILYWKRSGCQMGASINAMSSLAKASLSLSPSSPSVLSIVRDRRRDFAAFAKEGSDGDMQAEYSNAEQVRPRFGVDAHKQEHTRGKSDCAENVEACCRELRAMFVQGGEVCVESDQVIGNRRRHSV